MSSFLFPSEMHYSSLLSPHYNNLESAPAPFTWLRFYLAKICGLYREMGASWKAWPTRFPQGIPVRTQAQYVIKPLNTIKHLTNN